MGSRKKKSGKKEIEYPIANTQHPVLNEEENGVMGKIMNEINEKLNRAQEQIKPISFDSIKIIVQNISETDISKGQRLKILPANNHEIITIFKGAATCKIDSTELTIQEKDKDIIFIPNNKITICTPREDTVIFRIQILIDTTTNIAMPNIQKEINKRISESGFRFMGHWKLCRLFEKIKTEISNSYPFSELKISLLIQDFILTFLRIYFTELDLVTINHKNQNLMGKVDSFIETNLGNKISAIDLATECRLSARQTTRVIKKATGLSPTKYIQKIKMTYAHQELRNGTNIKEIADDLGYQDLSYFYRCFKQEFGTTPGKSVKG
jgi:AraC-like DNA-binding protein